MTSASILPARPANAIDLTLSPSGVARTSGDGVEVEVAMNDTQAGLTWSLSQFRTSGPDTIDIEGNCPADYVFTQVPLVGGFETELACGTVYSAQSVGLVRPRRAAGRFRFSHPENQVFGVQTSLETIESWFGDEVPEGVRPLLADAQETVHAPQLLPAYLHHSLRAALQSHLPMRGHMIEAAAFQILGFQLERLVATPSRGPKQRDLDLAREVRRLLEGAPHDPPSMSDLAAMLECSVRQLNKAYRAIYGCSVYQSQLDLRFQTICSALLQGEPIKEIAHRFGYSASSFTLAFRNRTGLPPRRWLDEQANGRARSAVLTKRETMRSGGRSRNLDASVPSAPFRSKT